MIWSVYILCGSVGESWRPGMAHRGFLSAIAAVCFLTICAPCLAQGNLDSVARAQFQAFGG